MRSAALVLSSCEAQPKQSYFTRASSLGSIVTSHSSSFRPLLGILVIFFFLPANLKAQNDSVAVDTSAFEMATHPAKKISDATLFNRRPTLTTQQKTKRIWFVTGVNVAGYGTSLILFSNAWYKNYTRTSFHTFNDSKEWLQVDKAGHAWAAYNTGQASTAMWRWAGLSHKKAVLIGGLSGAAYLTVIEFLDAHSSKWGWSWSDIGANILGSGLFMGQEFLWNEQRIQFKFSFHGKNYGDPQLDQRADDLFGKSWYERMLKDYNAQAYWFSVNLHSFLPKSNLPAWLNIAVGYGADGMFGGFENKWMNNLGNDVTRYDIPRKRQFYLAPDIDFTKIPTKKKWLKTAFSFLNAFKCPAPALMLDSKGKFRAYALYF